MIDYPLQAQALFSKIGLNRHEVAYLLRRNPGLLDAMCSPKPMGKATKSGELACLVVFDAMAKLNPAWACRYFCTLSHHEAMAVRDQRPIEAQDVLRRPSGEQAAQCMEQFLIERVKDAARKGNDPTFVCHDMCRWLQLASPTTHQVMLEAIHSKVGDETIRKWSENHRCAVMWTDAQKPPKAPRELHPVLAKLVLPALAVSEKAVRHRVESGTWGELNDILYAAESTNPPLRVTRKGRLVLPGKTVHDILAKFQQNESLELGFLSLLAPKSLLEFFVVAQEKDADKPDYRTFVERSDRWGRERAFSPTMPNGLQSAIAFDQACEEAFLLCLSKPLNDHSVVPALCALLSQVPSWINRNFAERLKEAKPELLGLCLKDKSFAKVWRGVTEQRARKEVVRQLFTVNGFSPAQTRRLAPADPSLPDIMMDSSRPLATGAAAVVVFDALFAERSSSDMTQFLCQHSVPQWIELLNQRAEKLRAVLEAQSPHVDQMHRLSKACAELAFQLTLEPALSEKVSGDGLFKQWLELWPEAHRSRLCLLVEWMDKSENREKSIVARWIDKNPELAASIHAAKTANAPFEAVDPFLEKMGELKGQAMRLLVDTPRLINEIDLASPSSGGPLRPLGRSGPAGVVLLKSLAQVSPTVAWQYLLSIEEDGLAEQLEAQSFGVYGGLRKALSAQVEAQAERELH